MGYDYFIHVLEPDLPVKKSRGRPSATNRTLSPSVLTHKEWMRSRGRILKGLPEYDQLKDLTSEASTALTKKWKLRLNTGRKFRDEKNRLASKLLNEGQRVGLLECLNFIGKKIAKNTSKQKN